MAIQGVIILLQYLNLPILFLPTADEKPWLVCSCHQWIRPGLGIMIGKEVKLEVSKVEAHGDVLVMWKEENN